MNILSVYLNFLEFMRHTNWGHVIAVAMVIVSLILTGAQIKPYDFGTYMIAIAIFLWLVGERHMDYAVMEMRSLQDIGFDGIVIVPQDEDGITVEDEKGDEK